MANLHAYKRIKIGGHFCEQDQNRRSLGHSTPHCADLRAGEGGRAHLNTKIIQKLFFPIIYVLSRKGATTFWKNVRAWQNYICGSLGR